jgi:Protein of unknown function (DUF1573)
MNMLFVAALVLAVGGPQATPVAVAGPTINAEPASFDFGKVLQNKTVQKQFVIRNIGTEDLVIERVSTTCGCTVADGYAKLVKPGQSTNMNVQLNTRTFKGAMERRVLIRSNDASHDPLELKVQVTVVAP